MKTNRGEDSKKRILAATTKLLAKKNPDKVSLDLIAQKSGLAKSSILWHFKSKEELMLAVVTEIFENFIEQFNGANQELSPLEALDRFFDEYAVFAKEKPEANIIVLTFMLSERNNKKMTKKLRELYCYFREGFIEGLQIKKNENNKYMVSFLIAALDGFFMQWLLDPKEIDLQKSFALLKDIVIQYMKNQS